MKQILILLALATLFLSGSAQKAKEFFYDINWKSCDAAAASFYSLVQKTDSGYERKDYYISTFSTQMEGLFTDEETENKSGDFTYFYANKFLESKGRYSNNKKEGVWLQYYPNGAMEDSSFYSNNKKLGICISWHSNGFIQDSLNINEEGNGFKASWYDDGSVMEYGKIINHTKEHGRWFYFHKNGKLSAVVEYNEGAPIKSSCYDENGNEEMKKLETATQASYGKHKSSWNDYLVAYFVWPEGFIIKNAESVTSIMQFTIKENGEVDDVFSIVPVHPEFDELLKNVIQQSKKWKPAKEHNRNVKSTLRIPVTFSIKRG
jgi:Gram-negative bacterial TonB protein C-terminal